MNEIPIAKIAQRLRGSAIRPDLFNPELRELGGDSWIIDQQIRHRDGKPRPWRRIIVSYGPRMNDEGTDHLLDDLWLHASVSRPDEMPSYNDLANLHDAVWPDGWAYQVFAPSSAHVNIHQYALHLWGRFDGSRELPNFGVAGSI